MKKRLLMPLHLQFFADPDGGSGEPGGTGTPPAGDLNPNDPANPDDPDGAVNGDKTFTRDEVAKMIAAETKKAMEATEAKLRAEKDEAAKLAKMDEKEKTDYEKQKLQEEIDALKKEKTLVEMTETASEMLSDKGSKPTKGMLRLIVSEDAETTSTNVKTYLESIEAEREVMKLDFEKRLGSKLPMDGTTSTTLSRGAQMAKEINNQTKKPELNPWATN